MTDPDDDPAYYGDNYHYGDGTPVPLYATPAGMAELRRWAADDPDSYCQWLDDEWAREHPTGEPGDDS